MTSEKILVKGFVYDETTLAELKVNGRNIPMPVAKEFEIEEYITAKASAGGTRH